MSGKLKKLAGQTVLYGLPGIIGRFINYLLTPIITRAFLPSEFGVVTEMYAYVGFFMILLTYGMETGFFRFASKHENPKIVFTSSIIPLIVTSLLFVILAAVFAQNIAELIKYPDNSEYIIWFAFILAADAVVSIPFAKLRIEGKAKKFALFRFLNISVNILVTIWFIVLCKNNENPALNRFFVENFEFMYSKEIGVGYIFIANLAASIFTLILFIPDFFKQKFIFDTTISKQILKYSFPLLFAGLAGIINEVADRILLKFFTVVPETVVDTESYVRSQVGIYGANYKLAILMTLFIQAFRYAAEPFFFSHHKDKKDTQIYADVMKFFIIFCLIIFLGVMLYIDIAQYFIAKEYREGLVVVPILLMANLFLGIIYNLSIWYKLTDKTLYGAYLAGFGAFLTIVLNVVLIPEIGYLGAAWATFFCYFAMMILSYFWGQKHFYVKYETRKIILYISFALIVFFASKYLSIYSNSINLLINTTLFLLYIGVISYFEKIQVLVKSKLFKR